MTYMPTETNFDCAITKFGYKKVFEAFEACTRMHGAADEVCAISNLYPFMIAASYEKSALSIIYYLMRRHPSLLDHTCTRTHAYNEKKRKRSILGPGEQR